MARHGDEMLTVFDERFGDQSRILTEFLGEPGIRRERKKPKITDKEADQLAQTFQGGLDRFLRLKQLEGQLADIEGPVEARRTIEALTSEIVRSMGSINQQSASLDQFRIQAVPESFRVKPKSPTSLKTR